MQGHGVVTFFCSPWYRLSTIVLLYVIYIVIEKRIEKRLSLQYFLDYPTAMDTAFLKGCRVIQNGRLIKITLLDIINKNKNKIVRKCPYHAQVDLSLLNSSNLY